MRRVAFVAQHDALHRDRVIAERAGNADVLAGTSRRELKNNVAPAWIHKRIVHPVDEVLFVSVQINRGDLSGI